MFDLRGMSVFLWMNEGDGGVGILFWEGGEERVNGWMRGMNNVGGV